ncbi:MAG: tRNA lysidine(34) synthetase TilS [Cyanobacteriota bacterium]
MAAPWSRFHLRLHRLLLRRPQLLPQHATLLLAVSGGQDSMALVGLLRDLQRLHHWRLLLWHGDHGWRPESAQQASALADWAAKEGLPLERQRWDTPMPDEASARQWRLACLQHRAALAGASRVVTGHTASDRAETLLLNLARGSHRRGLASLRPLRPLGDAVQLARPLLVFSRGETAEIQRQLQLPVWSDPSNDNPRFSRNRIRAEVLPVLEALHPGAGRRLSGLSSRLADEQDSQEQLEQLALQSLLSDPNDPRAGLRRRALMALEPGNRRRLLRAWLQHQGNAELAAAPLERLLERLEPERGPGALQLPGGSALHWDRERLQATAGGGKQGLASFP